jgi:hypothetical protein
VWFKVDDAFWSHPKIVKAGNAAIGLWIRCGTYCNQHETDGFISAAVARQLGSAGLAARLVEAGLWIKSDDPCGYLMHDYADYQPLKATVIMLRESNAKRQRTYREKHLVSESSNGVTNSAPTQPVPDPYEGGRSQQSRGRHVRAHAEMEDR